MKFKLIIAFVEDSKTQAIMNSAREAGATGCTVLTNARGQGVEEKTTFLGLALESQRDMVLMLVEEHRARGILEKVAETGKFDQSPGTGIAFQVDVEDALGVMHQVELIAPSLEEAEL
jgi:nitrogen regulatory protein PII